MPMTGSFSFVEGTALVMSGRLFSSAASTERPTVRPTVASTPDFRITRREKFDRSDADIVRTPFLPGNEGGRLNRDATGLSRAGGRCAAATLCRDHPALSR